MVDAKELLLCQSCPRPDCDHFLEYIMSHSSYTDPNFGRPDFDGKIQGCSRTSNGEQEIVV